MYVLYYIAQYPLRWTAESALHLFIPTPTRHLREAFYPRSKYARRLFFTHISTAVYSHIPLIYTSMLKLQNSSKWRNRTRDVSIASPVFNHWATALHVNVSSTFGTSSGVLRCSVQMLNESFGHHTDHSYIIPSALLKIGIACIGSKAMKVPTITTSFLFVCAKGRAE